MVTRRAMASRRQDHSHRVCRGWTATRRLGVRLVRQVARTHGINQQIGLVGRKEQTLRRSSGQKARMIGEGEKTTGGGEKSQNAAGKMKNDGGESKRTASTTILYQSNGRQWPSRNLAATAETREMPARAPRARDIMHSDLHRLRLVRVSSDSLAVPSQSATCKLLVPHLHRLDKTARSPQHRHQSNLPPTASPSALRNQHRTTAKHICRTAHSNHSPANPPAANIPPSQQRAASLSSLSMSKPNNRPVRQAKMPRSNKPKQHSRRRIRTRSPRRKPACPA